MDLEYELYTECDECGLIHRCRDCEKREMQIMEMRGILREIIKCHNHGTMRSLARKALILSDGEED
jgi:hypothetical protein